MPLWIDPEHLPPETSAGFDHAEGTLNLEVTLEPPLEAPDEREAILFFETPAKTLVTVELDEQLRFYFGRRAPGIPAVYAVADGTPLIGMERMAIEASWSPLGLAIRVTDRKSGESVSSEPAA
jgi:hypothetical protein